MFATTLLLCLLLIEPKHGQDLTVVTVESEPFVKFVNNEYEGFCVDLLEKIAYIIPGFKYKWKQMETNGSYNGMIQELVNGKADLAVTDLKITSEREAEVDFSLPFMNVGISILYKRPSLILSYLWIGFLTVFLLITGALSQGTMKIEQLINTRILLSSSWLFFFFAAVYFYLITEPHSIYNDIEELFLQNNVKFGLIPGGSTESFFRNSNFHIYQKIWKTIEFGNQNELIQRVKKEDGKFAVFIPSVTIEYLVAQDCDFIQVGAPINSNRYGIAMKQGLRLRDKINQALVQLQETGVINQLKEKWWKNKEGTICPKIEPLRLLFTLSILSFTFLTLAIIIEAAKVVWKKYRFAGIVVPVNIYQI